MHTKKLKYLGSAVKIGSVGLRQSNNFFFRPNGRKVTCTQNNLHALTHAYIWINRTLRITKQQNSNLHICIARNSPSHFHPRTFHSSLVFHLFQNKNDKLSVSTTDIERRSQNSYTALCNGVVNHGAPIGGIQVFANHTRGNKRKQNVSTIFPRRAAFHECLSSHSDHSLYAPDESQLF